MTIPRENARPNDSPGTTGESDTCAPPIDDEDWNKILKARRTAFLSEWSPQRQPGREGPGPTSLIFCN